MINVDPLDFRYRHQFRSDTILGELKNILQHLQQPYFDLFVVSFSIILSNTFMNSFSSISLHWTELMPISTIKKLSKRYLQ